MNRSHNFYFGEMNKIIGVHTPPASLQFRIDLLRGLIAKGCGTPSMRAMLDELESDQQDQKAQEIVKANWEQVEKVRDGLQQIAGIDAPYPPELLAARRETWIGLVKAVQS